MFWFNRHLDNQDLPSGNHLWSNQFLIVKQKTRMKKSLKALMSFLICIEK